MAPCRSGADVIASTSRSLDVIDARPRFEQADADRLIARFDGVDTEAMLSAILADESMGRIAVVSSFGTESAVLLDLVARADTETEIVFVDTLKMFPETLEYRELLLDRLGLSNSRIVTPNPEVLLEKDETGLRWSFDPDGCCAIRKVEPLVRAKDGLDCWISGRKAFQSVTRENIPRFEVQDGKLKINPLGDWTKTDLEAWFEKQDLPRHPLEAQGYLSVGCAPCTSKVNPGEDARAGRWRGWDKVECGIHTPDAGEKSPEDPVF